MNRALIIGSGAAAAGAALALSRRKDLQITVVDIGLQLEAERQQIVNTLAASPPGDWDTQIIEGISKQPVDSKNRSIPQKQVFGSDYPFRNVGQLGGLTVMGDATASLISSAYGGFSNVWGSQIMPFTAATFENWPITADLMRVHYEKILTQIPFAGEEDDLATFFSDAAASCPTCNVSQKSTRIGDV